MSFPAMTPFEVISLGDISISLARGHYQFASTALPLDRTKSDRDLTLGRSPQGGGGVLQDEVERGGTAAGHLGDSHQQF